MSKCAVKYNTTREDAATDVNFKKFTKKFKATFRKPFSQFFSYLTHRSFVPTFVRIGQKP